MKKVLRYASLLLAAAMLAVSCGDPADPQTPVTPENPENPENPEKPEQPQEPVTGTLTLSVDKQIIQSNGSDAATFTVKLDDKDITSDIVFRDSKSGDAVIKTDGMKFTTTEAKEYAIWAEYKTLMSNEVKVTAVASEVPETPEAAGAGAARLAAMAAGDPLPALQFSRVYEPSALTEEYQKKYAKFRALEKRLWAQEDFK